MAYVTSTDELHHHGVMGMKWGKRKAKFQASKANRKARKEYNKEWQSSYKDRHTLSDAELRQKVNRLQMESNYARLVAETRVSDRKKAKKYMSQFNKQHAKSGEAVGNINKTINETKKLGKSAAAAALL